MLPLCAAAAKFQTSSVLVLRIGSTATPAVTAGTGYQLWIDEYNLLSFTPSVPVTSTALPATGCTLSFAGSSTGNWYGVRAVMSQLKRSLVPHP